MLPGISTLRIKDFRNLWIGQTISQFGDSIYMLVFLFAANKLAKDSSVVGLVAALQAIPFVIFGPVAGLLADWTDRRRIMVITDLLSGIIMLGLSIYLIVDASPPIWVIAASGFLMSSVNAFFMPARSAAIPQVVPADQLVDANGLAMATQQAMAMLAIALSASILGIVYKLLPDTFFAAACFVNAITFFASMVFVWRLPKLHPTALDVESEAAEPTAPQPSRLRRAIDKAKIDLAEGLRAIWRDGVAGVGLILNCIITLFISGFMVLYVQVNDQWFGGSFATFAWLEFSFAITMLVMSLFIGRFKIRRPGAAYAYAAILCGLFVGLMAYAQSIWIFIVLNVLCGIVVPFMMLPLVTYLQLAFPNEMRGRVSSAWTMIAMGVQPVGLLVAGALIKPLGISGLFWFMGIGMMVGCGLGLLSKRFRETEMPVPSEATP